MIKATWVKTYVKGLDSKEFHEDFEYRCIMDREDFSDFSEEEAIKSKRDIVKDIFDNCAGKGLVMKPKFTKKVLETFLEDDKPDLFLLAPFEETKPLPIPSLNKDHKGYLRVGILKNIVKAENISMSCFDPEELDMPAALFMGSLNQKILYVYHEELIREENLMFLLIKNFRNSFGKIVKKLVAPPFASPEEALAFFDEYERTNPTATESVNVYIRAADYETELKRPWFKKEIDRISKTILKRS